MTPAELARLIVPMGTTAVISDSHEIGNVLGVRGDRHAGRGQRGAAARPVLHGVVVRAGDALGRRRRRRSGPAEVRELLARPRVLGLAEVMDIPAVLGGRARRAREGRRRRWRPGRVVDGHAAGLSGRELIAYAAAGIRSDHESTTVEEARAKAALGMLVQVREGSSAQNLDALLPLLAGGELDDSWCLVTDDIFPNDLRRHGHIDGLLRRVVAGGVAPAVAVRHASYVPARHYGLVDRGAVAPGYRADLVAGRRPARTSASDTVIKDGRVVARDGRCLDHGPAPRLDHENTVHLPPLDESAFRLPLAGETCPVIEIVPDQIVTRRDVAERAPGRRRTGRSTRSATSLLIASIERHRASGRIGLGLVSGFGLTRDGALGLVGRARFAQPDHRRDQSPRHARLRPGAGRARRRFRRRLRAGQVRAMLPLPVAGLLSLEDADTVCRQLDEVNRAARALGCPLEAPFGTLSFLALPVIPELRITTQGVFDVREQQFPHAYESRRRITPTESPCPSD